MKSDEIKTNVQSLIGNFSKEEFIYDLLIAYGISKTSVTRLKKGDYNLSKVDGEILYKKKIFFKVEVSDKLLSSIEEIAKEERISKYKPRFAILTDYKHIVAKDLKLNKNLDIEFKELPNYFDFFLPLAGSEVYNATNDNEADRNAAYKMASLYDLLIEENPNIYNAKTSIHNLNIFLSRLLFCFFAEDTEIFEEDSIFTNTLAQHTSKNGEDTHAFLDDLFNRLNDKKADKYPDYLAKFPYVNGGLFSDNISSPIFTAEARKILIDLGELQWKYINPDIFGSMIQAVVTTVDRSNLGKHYTSVPNILKLIKPLFLDEFYLEFKKAKTVKQLRSIIFRMSKIKFFDPACGSGNFLIISYKEIRLLEIKILQKITDLEPTPTFKWTSVRLSQFYGIEIDDFAHEIAILSLWLAEHQMNQYFEQELGRYGKSKPILPLKKSGEIQLGNATRIDWKKVCPIDKNDEVYIIGNPPYLGARLQGAEQKKDMDFVFHKLKKYRDLDYINCWVYKGAQYILGNSAKCAFLTTNSICQGLLVSLTWNRVLNDKIEIDFAHQSFKWTNNAKGNAGVTVIILGLRNSSNETKYLFKGEFKKEVKNISPYLISGSNLMIRGVSKPISNFPEIRFGNMPNDGGNLILENSEKSKLIDENPKIKEWIKNYTGGSDFIRGNKRHVLWINDTELELAKKNPEIKLRLEKVALHRIKSTEKSTREKAEFPNQFYFTSHQSGNSIIIPATSSERREYIPIGFLNDETIISNSAMAIYDAQPWLFAVVTSKIHMVWVRAVGGKLKTDYRYSAKLCYNTFPFPEISKKQKELLKLYVFDILDERSKYGDKTMAQLYNPETMPKGLLQAHRELDKAVERCYRLQPFKNDTERLEYLFKLYEEMVKKDTLFAKQKKTRKKKAK